MESHTETLPDFIGDCDGAEEEIAANPKNASSDLKVKLRNLGQCIIELILDTAGDEENSYTIELEPQRSYALSVPPGSVLLVACTECLNKKCMYSYEIA